MNLSDIDEIENKTGLVFPKWYIDIVTDYPKELIGTDAPDFALLDDPTLVIEENIHVRKYGYFGEKWPERYLIVGLNGCGDYWVVVTDSDTFSIGFSDHETMECRPYASSLNEFTQKYLSEVET